MPSLRRFRMFSRSNLAIVNKRYCAVCLIASRILRLRIAKYVLTRCALSRI